MYSKHINDITMIFTIMLDYLHTLHYITVHLHYITFTLHLHYIYITITLHL